MQADAPRSAGSGPPGPGAAGGFGAPASPGGGRPEDPRPSEELQRLRAALATAELHLADVHAVAGLCTWTTDAQGGDLRFSASAREVLGIDPGSGQIDVETVRLRMRPEDRALLRADRVRVLAGEPAVTSRFQFRRDDGCWRWMESRATLRADDQGRPARMIGTVRDVTDLLESQRDLESHRARLEDLVVSRTVRLAEASERAEAAIKARNDFLAHTSHEIRTPLNAIVSLAHLLQRAEQDPARLARAQAIEQSGQHLGALIDDLLNWARAGEPQRTARTSPVDPGRVLDEVATMLRPQAQARGLQVLVDAEADPGDCVLLGDAARLRQALLNLGHWVLDHSDQGPVRLHVQHTPGPGGTAVLKWALDCPTVGLRLDPDADAGLSSLKHLADQMGGRSGCDPLDAAGSRCWFTAVLACGDAPAPQRPPPGDALAAQLRGRHTGRRVLVAEDDAVNQLLLQELLADVGLRVDVAEDGQQAVEMAAVHPYALVALDLRMPRLDGLQAARALREMPALRHTPIVAVTANAFEEDRAACRAAGMNDFLPKPVHVDRLYELLLHWLDRSPTGWQTSVAPSAAAGSGQASRGAVGAMPPAQPDPTTPSPAPAVGQPPSRFTAAGHAPAPDPRMAPLYGLEGIDPIDGLAAVGGRVDVYRRLLGVFVSTHGDDGRTSVEQVRAGDTQGAARLAHRLRGSAATLGLVDVETAASALERAVEHGDPNLPVGDRADALARAVEQTVTTLRHALAVVP